MYPDSQVQSLWWPHHLSRITCESTCPTASLTWLPATPAHLTLQPSWTTHSCAVNVLLFSCQYLCMWSSHPLSQGHSEANCLLITGPVAVRGGKWDDFYVRINLGSAPVPRCHWVDFVLVLFLPKLTAKNQHRMAVLPAVPTWSLRAQKPRSGQNSKSKKIPMDNSPGKYTKIANWVEPTHRACGS